jgi:hypothetical protein
MVVSQKWEYAEFFFQGGMGKGRHVRFTHREDWDKVGTGELMDIMRRLGEDGWEMVSHSTTGDGWSSWYFKRPLAE